MRSSSIALCLVLLALVTFLCGQTYACTSVKTDECPRLFHKVLDNQDNDLQRAAVKTLFGVVNLSNASGKCKKAMKDYICAESYTKCDVSGTYDKVCRSVCEARAKACGMSSDDCKNLPSGLKCSGRVNASSATTTTVSMFALVIVAIATIMNAMF